MASGQTKNYGLNQWQAEDQVLREEFNKDNERLDIALSDLKNAKGNCRITAGSYTGTGLYGETHPCTLTLDFEPQVIFMDVRVHRTVNATPFYFLFLRGATTAAGPNSRSGNVYLTWEGASVSWYTSDSAEKQFNSKDIVYHYIAIG